VGGAILFFSPPAFESRGRAASGHNPGGPPRPVSARPGPIIVRSRGCALPWAYCVVPAVGRRWVALMSQGAAAGPLCDAVRRWAPRMRRTFRVPLRSCTARRMMGTASRRVENGVECIRALGRMYLCFRAHLQSPAAVARVFCFVVVRCFAAVYHFHVLLDKGSIQSKSRGLCGRGGTDEKQVRFCAGAPGSPFLVCAGVGG